MASKFVLALLAFGFVVDMAAACAATTPSATTTTAAPSGRKRRDAEQTAIELFSNVPIAQASALIQKLKTQVAAQNLDLAKYGRVEHQIGSSANGDAIITVEIPNKVNCAELRAVAGQIVHSVSEIQSANIHCGGTQAAL